MAEICPTAIMELMPVNQVDTAFEYAVIFVCYIIFRVSQQHRPHNCCMIMLLNIIIDHLHIKLYLLHLMHEINKVIIT